MENLTPSNCQTLAALANDIQAAISGPCVNAFLAVINNPQSTSETIEAATIERDRCLANLRNERLQDIMTDPSAPETMQTFEEYVAEYGEDTLHDYIPGDEASKQKQFNEWKVGCGSAPEPLWFNSEICSCDCKKTLYVENGVVKEDTSFYIQPKGKTSTSSPAVFSDQSLNIVINGKMIQRNLITAGREYKIETIGIPQEEPVAGNLKSKLFFTSSEKKRQLLVAQTA
jgi:hypothetical protein